MKPRGQKAKKKPAPQKAQLSPEEQRLMQQAEAQAAQAAKQLEASKAKTGQAVAGFGAPTQPFSVADDMAAMNEFMGQESVPQQQQYQQEPLNTPVPEQQVQEEPQEQQPQQEQGLQLSEDPAVRMKQISDYFKEKHNPNFPSAEQLLHWKNVTGDVFLLDLNSHVFVYRYIKRQEWIQINSDPNYANLKDNEKDDSIFNRCVLWPQLSPPEVAMLPAGCVGLIVQQINLESMFLDPIQVSNLTIKL
jgi:hypothetical protein